jgi:hypothetical protein
VVLWRYARLAPIYYLVFLFGWQLGPFLGSGPTWFTYEKGYSDCDAYWWSVFTMTINFFPSYVIANEGCYFWGWFPPCEIQIFLVLPFLVYAACLMKGPKAKTAFIASGLLVGIAINFWIIWTNRLAAAMFAPQDIAIYRLFINKPYTKVCSVFLGIAMAFMLTDIRSNRSDPSSRWARLKSSVLYVVISYSVAFALLCYIVFSPISANKHPPAWSNLRNSLFISLSRPLFIMCLMVFMINMFIGRGQGLKAFFASSFWVPLSSLSYLVYLIFPILNAVLISSMPQSLFLSYINVVYLLIGNYVF